MHEHSVVARDAKLAEVGDQLGFDNQGLSFVWR